MNVRDNLADKFHAVDNFRFAALCRTAAGQRFLEVKHFRFQLFLFFQQVADTCFQIVDVGFQRVAGTMQFIFHRIDIFFRAFAGNAFNTPYAGRYRRFRNDVEIADFSGVANVRSAAQLARINFSVFFHRNHANLFAVFFAEQCHCAGFNGFILIHQYRVDMIIGTDGRINHIFGQL